MAQRSVRDTLCAADLARAIMKRVLKSSISTLVRASSKNCNWASTAAMSLLHQPSRSGRFGENRYSGGWRRGG